MQQFAAFPRPYHIDPSAVTESLVIEGLNSYGSITTIAQRDFDVDPEVRRLAAVVDKITDYENLYRYGDVSDGRSFCARAIARSAFGRERLDFEAHKVEVGLAFSEAKENPSAATWGAANSSAHGALMTLHLAQVEVERTLAKKQGFGHFKKLIPIIVASRGGRRTRVTNYDGSISWVNDDQSLVPSITRYLAQQS